jgi:hypothetical protein
MMKRNKVFAAMGILATVCVVVSADVILPNYHYAPYCDKIINVSDFPDIVVIGYVSYFMSSTSARYIVNHDSCLFSGNKYVTSCFIWAPKHYVDSVGLDSLPLAAFVNGLSKKNGRTSVSATSDLHLLSKTINTYGGLVPDSTQLPVLVSIIFF